ncbi:ubiquitin-conjugating enzyme [Nadsonia fulvescens var. elongata DSM 6958]|uniref:Ubiquitin-conjugating enzyme n=1 Tax=Nadsonia fulvescens var. elongata DSM 6958 TaxID=857566 RepID=A0A1E3PE23_9ASCO|nr:ubiquitin-conjugating enzyme [Nadsonia fulvescens var. elongata DSM 6958]
MDICKRRLMKELSTAEKGLPSGLTLVSANDLTSWYIDITVDSNSLYQGQIYRLMFMYSPNYPMKVPNVQFVPDENRPIPIHPHIYANGHICLDILGDGWTPVQNTVSVCLSIQSMLAGNHTNERPPDNDSYVRSAPKYAQDSRFIYHDDSV